MKISQLKTNLIKEHNNHCKKHNEIMIILEMLPESLDASSAYLNTVHLNAAPYAENMETLHLIREHCGNYKLGWYGTSRKDVLSLQYIFDGFKLFMTCTDAENALAIVSDGKCKFEDTEEIIKATEETIRKGVTIVCPVA